MPTSVDCRIEHVAFNVPDPAAMAGWYVTNLGMRILRAQERSPFAHFLADAAGGTVLEIYHNPLAPVPPYSELNPLVLHVAFATNDVVVTRDRLLAAGATLVNDARTMANGDVLAMLRDPWGLAIQLADRGRPLQ